MVVEIFEFLWMGGWERTESPYPKMDSSKNGLFWWVGDLPKFWGLTVIWLKYIPNDFDSRSKLSEWEHNLWPSFLDIQSWKMLCNADSSHIYFWISCLYDYTNLLLVDFWKYLFLKGWWDSCILNITVHTLKNVVHVIKYQCFVCILCFYRVKTYCLLFHLGPFKY